MTVFLTIAIIKKIMQLHETVAKIRLGDISLHKVCFFSSNLYLTP